MNSVKQWSFKFIIAFVSLVNANNGVATTTNDNNAKRPIGCRDTGYNFSLKTLHLLPRETLTTQALYFIYNYANKPVNLYQMRPNDSARSMFMNHAIEPHYWAVLSTTEPNKHYICTVANANLSYGSIVDCADYLQVCRYPHVKYGMNNQGNFWLVNNSTRNGAVNEVVHYGIIPGV